MSSAADPPSVRVVLVDDTRGRSAGRDLDLSRPLIMGIVNVTPDSFSDGGRYLSAPAALEHARRLIDEGADLLDIGGESTRPGAADVSESEEIERVVPLIEALRSSGAVVGRYQQARRDARCARCRRGHRQRRARVPGAGCARGRRGERLRPRADAHAGHAADDAAGPALWRCRTGSARLPARHAWPHWCRRVLLPTASPLIRASASARRWSTISPAARAGRR